jgi:hypothetical protein
LAEAAGDPLFRSKAIHGLVILAIRRANLGAALALARKLESDAAGPDDRGNWVDRLTAHRLVGISLFFMGDQASARLQLERAVGGDFLRAARSHANDFGLDHRTSALCFLGNVLWLQGLPDQAQVAVHSAIDEARGTGHLASVCHALAFGSAVVALRLGEWAETKRRASELLELSSKLSSDIYRAIAEVVLLLVDAQQSGAGQRPAAISTLLADMRQRQTWFLSVLFAPDFAELVGSAGHVDEALAILDEGEEIAGRGGGQVGRAERMRVRGGLALKRSSPDFAAAERAYRQALAWAQQQGALSWELRAATSLADLHRSRGNESAAREVIAPLYGRFTEGFETADLRRARGLLVRLDASPRSDAAKRGHHGPA